VQRPASPSPLAAIDALGERIEQGWLEADYREAAFPEIARVALEQAAPENVLDLDGIFQWALETVRLPEQDDVRSAFGNPPLTLYQGREFHIVLLLWVDGTTSIHQHAFSGAFRVVAGSSIQTTYEFETTRVLNNRIKLGRATPASPRLLGRGDTLVIPAGDAFIHSLFHLERPSATLVVRTDVDRFSRPQFEYYPPGLALASFVEPAWLARQLQLVRLLHQLEHRSFGALVARLLGASDPFAVFRILSSLRNIPNRRMFDGLVESTAERHGPDYAEALRAAFSELRRLDFIVGCRRAVWDPELRFFLALLLNVKEPPELLRLIREYRPDEEPLDCIVDWLVALSNSGTRPGGAGLPAFNRFGLPALGEDARSPLRRLLASGSLEPSDTSPAVLEAERALQRSPAFAPLLRPRGLVPG